MNVTTKLGLYALGLVAVFAVTFGAGSLVGPVLPEQTVHSQDQGQDHDDLER